MSGRTFNQWWLSLPEGRRLLLAEDKWMLAEAAFAAAISAQARASEAEDAARWRWFRDGDGDSPMYPGANLMLMAWYDHKQPSFEVSDYDAAVDAARATQGDAGSRGGDAPIALRSMR